MTYFSISPSTSGSIASSSFASNLQTFSVSVWFKYSSEGSQFPMLVSTNNMGATAHGFEIFTDRDGGVGSAHSIGLEVDGTVSFYGVRNNTPVNDGLWHNIVVTYDNTVVIIANRGKVYLDGANVTTDAGANNAGNYSNNSPFHISDTSLPYTGQLADIRIFNTILSSGDAATIAAGGTVSSGIIAEWPMTEGTGSTLTDPVGSNTLTFSSGPTWSSDIPPQLANAKKRASTILTF